MFKSVIDWVGDITDPFPPLHNASQMTNLVRILKGKCIYT